jgi:hypothetical protein
VSAFVLTVVSIVVSSAPARANNIANGNFAANAAAYNTDPGYDSLGTNPAQPTSWNIHSNVWQGVNGTGVTWTPGDARDVFGPASSAGVNDFLFLQYVPGLTGYTYGGQSVAFLPNHTYTLSFDAAGRRDNADGWLGVVVNDGTGNFFDTRNASDINVSNAGWQHYSFTFTTTPGAHGLGSVIFANEAQNHGQNFDVSVDVSNVYLTPEPGSFVLCGLGFVGLLLASRRRK